jgi:LCP family protein required for cell wall assembly
MRDSTPGRVKAPFWTKLLVVFGALLIMSSGGGYYLVTKGADDLVKKNVQTKDFFAAIPASERPKPAPSGRPIGDDPINILMLGSDNAAGARGYQGVTGQRSDSIILLHISRGFKHVYAFSIERDTYVSIPGHGKTKINAALTYGGEALAVRTVQNLLHIQIDHVVVVSFEALHKVTDVVGGVKVFVDKTTYDNQDHMTWTRGWHTLNGVQAEHYVRQRHGLAAGDYDRMKRQQQFLRALIARATQTSILANPFKLESVVVSVAKSMTFDSGFPVKDFAFAAKDINLNAVTFATLPTAGGQLINHISYQFLNPVAANALGRAIKTDNFGPYFRRYRPNDVSHGL